MGQHEILKFLKENNKSYSSRDLKQHFDYNQSTIGNVLNKLKRSGFVKKIYKVEEGHFRPYYKYNGGNKKQS